MPLEEGDKLILLAENEWGFTEWLVDLHLHARLKEYVAHEAQSIAFV